MYGDMLFSKGVSTTPKHRKRLYRIYDHHREDTIFCLFFYHHSRKKSEVGVGFLKPKKKIRELLRMHLSNLYELMYLDPQKSVTLVHSLPPCKMN